MKILYLELLEREKWLKEQEQTSETRSRLSELSLAIMRVQELLLNELN